MRILLIGTFKSPIHEVALSNAFKKLGNAVFEIRTYPLFYQKKPSKYNIHLKLSNLYKRLQNKYNIGPILKKINKKVLEDAFKIKPELIFILRGVYIFPETITKLRNNGFIVFGYNNDDPFGKSYSRFYWRYFIQSIKLYDHLFAYRHSNIDSFKQLGAQSVSLLRSYYISSINYPISHEIIPSKFKNEVVFAGHYENDGRDKILLKLMQHGISTKIYGPEWGKSRHYNDIKKLIGDIKPLNYVDYNYVLNGAKIALVFLSKLNNDTYTRRCFEIPITKTLMIAEYSKDLSNLFENKNEIILFKNFKELETSIKFYLKNDDKREIIAKNGFIRVSNDKHEVKNRAEEIIKEYIRTSIN